MKRFIYLVIIILIASGCRSVRKTTVDYRHQKDSTSYNSVTTVDIDTTIVPQDSASFNIEIGNLAGGDTTYGSYSGPFGILSVQHDQGNDIKLDYKVEQTKSGNVKISVKASTKPKEILTQNTTTETSKVVQLSDVIQKESTKKVKGFSMWNMAWVIPLVLIGIVIYWKRKTIMKFLPF